MKLFLALGLLAFTFAACADAPPPPASTPVSQGNVTTLAPPPPPPGPPSLSDVPPPHPPCPSDVPASAGKACSFEGQLCGDPAKQGFGITCKAGSWQAGELPHPPCCKK